ncbi:hypothetical protein DFH09DRAFT_1069440 [Mycena vulgaris]|nr:hypothetical protein DFH09DRAFT_1069440 [Mycena vulgaris]
MQLPLVLVFFFPLYVFAQGDDTIASLSRSQNSTGNPLFSYSWHGETGHDEQWSGCARYLVGLSSVESNDGDFSYLFHKATPTGLYHVRMNGTIWNGATQIGATTVRSNTFNYTGPLFPLDPCHNNLTWTPVCSLSDPGYNPLRVTDPEGRDVVVPDSGLGIVRTMSKIDRTFDANNMNQTMELVNAQTGFSAGAQTIVSLPIRLDIITRTESHVQFRTNFTSSSAHNPGSWVLYSDVFFIVAAGTKPCVANSTSPASGTSTDSPPGSTPTGKGAGHRMTIPMVMAVLAVAATMPII